MADVEISASRLDEGVDASYAFFVRDVGLRLGAEDPMSARMPKSIEQLTRRVGRLIGVGGISTADEAYAKIRAGASAVQLYTALVYGGISLVDRITRDLDALLAADGFANVADAVGTGRADWL